MRGSSYFFRKKRESIPFRRLRLHSLLGGGCRRPYQRGATASCGGVSQNQHSVSRAPTTVNPPDPQAPHSEYHTRRTQTCALRAAFPLLLIPSYTPKPATTTAAPPNACRGALTPTNNATATQHTPNTATDTRTRTLLSTFSAHAAVTPRNTTAENTKYGMIRSNPP